MSCQPENVVLYHIRMGGGDKARGGSGKYSVTKQKPHCACDCRKQDYNQLIRMTKQNSTLFTPFTLSFCLIIFYSFMQLTEICHKLLDNLIAYRPTVVWYICFKTDKI